MAYSQDIPLYHFRLPQNEVIPFEIKRLEQLPPFVFSGRPVRVSFYEVLWITSGAGQRTIDFQTYPIQPNTMYFVTPGQVHSWNIQEPVTGFAILFTSDFLLLEQDFLRRFDFFHHIHSSPVFTTLH